MFRLSANSIGFEVGKRVFGRQDQGISPKGANDQTSFFTALWLLGDPLHFKCVELFFAKQIIFEEDVIFTFTGAHYQTLSLDGQTLHHATVYEAKKGAVLQLNKRLKGLRAYLVATQLDRSRIGTYSKGYDHYFPQTNLTIRVTQGPEFDYLNENFFSHVYTISTHSDMSGLRLDKALQAQSYDIITSAVTDGTIQLTKDGPIVLMRHRQTTGGYPRILNVIEADMDRLSQYPLHATVKFELIPRDRSVELLHEYEQTLQQIKEDLR